MLNKTIYDELAKRGYASRLVSVAHLAGLRRDIEVVYEQNILGDGIRKYVMNRFDFTLPEDFANAASILITAAQSPIVKIFFNYQGKRTPIIIPPTYVEINNTDEQIINLVKNIPGLSDYRLVKARLPEKLLAVRSGLGAYGRNNICYIPGLGSFMMLESFFTDIPCEEDNWHPLKMMDACGKCTICAKMCPAGAIAEGKDVINAERCITYYNEDDGVFPDWLDPSWHNCIVGCLLCQRACPANKDYLTRIVEGGEFSEAETEKLLRNIPMASLPPATRDKLARLNMCEYYSCLPRNLQALLSKTG